MINYAAEKFGSAIYSMATAVSEEDGRDRLYTAALTTGALQRDDFTPELWMRFVKFKERMTRVEDEKRGSFRATADSLSESEANDLLVEFYSLSVDVEQAYRDSESH
jgi:hypothetical protein